MALINFPETQRAVHLLQIIFNFLFCPVPVRYSTEIFAKFFHLPPICIQLWSPPAPARCRLSPKDGAIRPHLYLKQTVDCFFLCVRGRASFRPRSGGFGPALRVDVSWPRPGTPAALHCSAGWSISWLMTQQMFVARPVKRFPFPWPPCQECARTDGKTRTRSSSIIPKSYPGKQLQRAPSVLSAFVTTSPSPSYVIALYSLNIWSRRRRHSHEITLRIYEAIWDDNFNLMLKFTYKIFCVPAQGPFHFHRMHNSCYLILNLYFKSQMRIKKPTLTRGRGWVPEDLFKCWIESYSKSIFQKGRRLNTDELSGS